MNPSSYVLLFYFMAGDLIAGIATDKSQPITDTACSSNTTDPMFLCDKEHPATCIPRQSLCNGITDCPGGQDEAVSECGCLANEFRCSNSCVALVKRCDRHVDCEGGEDEHDCQTFLCPMTHFKCNNHFCVPLHSVCDFKDDCGDNSEEIYCPHRPCWNSEFRCNNGECLRPGYLCDSKENCMDGSDESFCGPEAFVECGDGSKVHSSYWCDDWPDCTDNHADEINCHECNTSYEFQCPNGRCIRMANRCDSQCDCIPLPNATSNICEDEINCDEYYTVKHGVVLCIPGRSLSCSAPSPESFNDNDNAKVRCIQPEYFCDGYNDCYNGYFLSDEFGCDENIPNQIDDESQMFICRDGRIMPANLRCDFKADCLHGDDEVGCPVVNCEPGQWTCSSGQCIDLKDVCNLQIDCFDKSDEINCYNYTCSTGQTKCTGSGQCIPQDFWCDHFLDCPDASDEINCRSRKCRFDEFRCNNGQCITAKYRCYNSGLPRSGCADGSHLLQCKDWECKSDQFKCHKGPCLHKSLLCDGSIHCAGSWEDEDNCSFHCSHMSPQCECRDVHLNCSQRNLTTVPVDTEKEITWFYLGGNRLNISLNNDTFLELGRLVYLDLSNNSIVEVPPYMFRSLWRLSVLDLHNNRITHFVNGTFYGLSSLKGLHLQGNNLQTLDSFAFSGLTFLTSMDLHGQLIEDIETDAFYGMRNLSGLDLSQNRLTFLSQGSLRGIPNLLFL